MFPKGLRIYAGYAMRDNLVCVALTRPDSGQPFSIVLIHEDGLPQPWTRVDVKRTIVSISDGRRAAGTEHCFVALSDEGDVYFLEAGHPIREKVPGVGIHSPDATGRGAATRAYSDGESGMLVIGQRGQVFRRTGPGQWHDIAPAPPPVEVTGDIVNPTAVLADYGGLLLAGYIFPVQMPNPEAQAARRAGNRRLYAQLKVRGARQQHGCVYRLEGGEWRRIALPTSVKLYDALARGDGTALIAGGHGTILSFEADEEIAALGGDETAEEMVCLCEAAGEVLVASEGALFRVIDDDIEGIPGPAGPLASVVRLVATDEALWAISTERICKREDGRWHDIEIPPNMLEIPFRG